MAWYSSSSSSSSSSHPSRLPENSFASPSPRGVVVCPAWGRRRYQLWALIAVLVLYLPLLIMLIPMVALLEQQEHLEQPQQEFPSQWSEHNNNNNKPLSVSRHPSSSLRKGEGGFQLVPGGSFPLVEAQRQMTATMNPPSQVTLSTTPHDDYYDVVIVGAGPAGLTAALFAARAGLSTIVMGSTMGLLSETATLENFPSWGTILPQEHTNGTNPSSPPKQQSGLQWLYQTRQQVTTTGVDWARSGLLVQSLDLHWYTTSTHDGSSSTRMIAMTDSSLYSLFELTLADSTTLWSRSVIVATGATPRRLHLPLEDEVLWGRSIHNCPICDGPSYVPLPPPPPFMTHWNPKVSLLVVGGGEAALDAALYLAALDPRHLSITLVHRRNTFRTPVQSQLWQLVQQTPNIELRTPYVVEEWLVEHQEEQHSKPEQQTSQQSHSSRPTIKLVGARLKKQSPSISSDQDNSNNMAQNPMAQPDSPERSTVSCQGAFLMIGATPNTQWLASHLDLDPQSGLIRLYPTTTTTQSLILKTQTSLPGVFAAGQVTDAVYQQAITAASEGAQAAMDAERWLRRQPMPRMAHRKTIQKAATTTTAVTLPVNHNLSGTTSSNPHPPKALLRHSETQNNENSKNDQVDNEDQCDLTKQECIERIVQTHPVVVFSKPWCPYCKLALESLSLEGLHHPYVIDLTLNGVDAHRVQVTLNRMTGRHTVPNVFVGGRSIGGGDETSALHAKGQLRGLLEEAGALPIKISNDAETVTASNKQEFNDKCDLTLDECMTSIVQHYPAVVFSSNTCPECHRLLEFFQNTVQVEELHVVELGPHFQIASGIRQQLERQANSRSVPSLFVGGQAIGGFRATNLLFRQGKLIPLLEKAGVQSKTGNNNGSQVQR